MEDVPSHAAYGLLWLSFGAVHSALAADGVKARLKPRLGAYYRLAYNLGALVHLALVLGLGFVLLGRAPAFALADAVRWGLVLVQGAGWLMGLAVLSRYDLARLSGLRQIRAHRAGRTVSDDEGLRTDGIHRFVRHPLYAAGFLILWGGTRDPFGLATALWGSLYLIVGARCEERRLLRAFGRAYADYRAAVPAFVPWFRRTRNGRPD